MKSSFQEFPLRFLKAGCFVSSFHPYRQGKRKRAIALDHAIPPPPRATADFGGGKKWKRSTEKRGLRFLTSVSVFPGRVSKSFRLVSSQALATWRGAR